MVTKLLPLHFVIGFCIVLIASSLVGTFGCKKQEQQGWKEEGNPAIDSTALDEHLAEAWSSIQSGDKGKAATVLEQSYLMKPIFPSQWLTRAKIALELNKPELALNDAKQLVRLDSSAGEGYQLIVLSCSQIRDPSDVNLEIALSSVRTVTKSFPQLTGHPEWSSAVDRLRERGH